MADLYQPECVCSKAEVDIYRMRDRTLQVTITTDVGDITDSLLWLTVKRELGDVDADAVITKLSANNGGSDSQAKVTDGINRIIEFYIDRTDTEDLNAGNY